MSGAQPLGPTGPADPAGPGPSAARGVLGDEPLPPFLQSLAARAAAGDDRLGEALRPVPEDWDPRRSAVLLLIVGRTPQEARLVIEERGHRMRSQPGQFALPGGGMEPGDADPCQTALREAREEIGLEPETVRVLGAFAPIALPWRSQAVHPVLAWAPTLPSLHRADPFEVERIETPLLCGPGSLTDPACRFLGTFDGEAVGPVFDLEGGCFVWGFTAMLIEHTLRGLGLAPADRADDAARSADAAGASPSAPPRIEIPAERRRDSARRPRSR